MLKGATGLKTIFSLVLGMMVLGTVGTAVTVGDLGDVIQQGLQDSKEFTDYTTEIDASDDGAEETFSDMVMFVNDRSYDCSAVDERNNGQHIRAPSDGSDLESDDPRVLNGNWPSEGGYPGLEGTRLGVKPICTGGSSTVIRDKYDWVPGRGLLGGGPEDNVMPGILSREKFEIIGDSDSDALYFNDSRPPTEDGETEYGLNRYWLENNIAGVSNQDPESHIATDHSYRYNDGTTTGTSEGSSAYTGSGRNYVFFFETDVGDNRTNKLLSERGYSDRVWAAYDEGGGSGDRDALWANEDRYFSNEVLLCPGDKGYIQRNRGTPMNTGLPDSTEGSENYYGMIVITETEVNNCGGIDGLGNLDPYSGPLSNHQLYIKASHGDWPNVDRFELRSQFDLKSRYVENLGDSSSCEIYYQEEDIPNTLADPGITLRTYAEGAHIDQNQETFRAGAGFDYDEQDHRVQQSGPGNSVERNAYSLLNAMSAEVDGDGLNGDLIDRDKTGELRPQNKNNGENELYGDLLCANTDDSNYAKWHICHERQFESRQEIEVNGDTWSCDTGSGEWSSAAEQSEERDYEGLTSGEQLYIYGGADAWPKVEELRLASRDEGPEIRRATGIDLEGDSETCEIFWRRKNRLTDGKTLRTYNLGTKIESDQTDFEFEHEDWEDGALAALGLLNAMALDGNTMNDPEATGELRPIIERFQANNEGQNELYGDLVCANPEDENYAEWHICNEKLEEGKRELEIYGNAWTCNTESGAWNQEVSAPETAVVTNDWTSISPETGPWFEANGEGFSIDSSATSEDISIDWSSGRMSDWNIIRVKVRPSETGHLRIGGLSRNSESRTYFAFDGGGTNTILVDEHNDGEGLKEVAEYEPSRNYTFVFSDFLDEVRILEEGTEVWSSRAELDALEFSNLQIYQGSGTHSWENIEATVEEVKITG